jgi:hypothetical protein
MRLGAICVPLQVKPVRCMGGGGTASEFLTSALDGDEWSASRLCPFNLRKDPRYSLDWRLGEPQSPSGRNSDSLHLKGRISITLNS